LCIYIKDGLWLESSKLSATFVSFSLIYAGMHQSEAGRNKRDTEQWTPLQWTMIDWNSFAKMPKTLLNKWNVSSENSLLLQRNCKKTQLIFEVNVHVYSKLKIRQIS